MKRLALVAALIAGTLTAAPHVEAQTLETYRVVGTGDSILSRVDVAGLLQSDDRWISTEPGREIDNPGVRGEASHAAIWAEIIARSRKGGFVIFQDDGTRVSDERWQEFLDHIVATTPSDRCLVGILPYYDPVLAPANHVLVKRHRNMMWRTFTDRGGCTLTLNWDQAAASYPQYLEDATHPNAAGQRFLASRIDLYVGYRRVS